HSLSGFVDTKLNRATEEPGAGAVIKQEQVPVWQAAQTVRERELLRISIKPKLIADSAHPPDHIAGVRVYLRHLSQIEEVDQVVTVGVSFDSVSVVPIDTRSGQGNHWVDVSYV